MIHKTHLSPEHSLVLVMDRSVGDVPRSMNQGLIAITETCIAIGTLSSLDGPATIVLSDEHPLFTDDRMELVFDGSLATPDREVSICSVADEPLLTIPVLSTKTKVRIWANHKSEPDSIAVVVGDVMII